MPDTNVNYAAIAVCVVVGMSVGFLWFGPIFGRAWARQMGLEDMPQPGGGAMARSMVLYAFGNLLIAGVLASLEVWRPSVWGTGPDEASWVYAANGALWTWVGFFLPLQIGRVAWEQRRWGLVAINGAFDLVRLRLFATILSYWRLGW